MNETIRGLHARKSTRAFTGKPVPDASKRQILAAAMQAPTAGCQMLYTILDITDPAKKARLATLCDNQPFIAEAPLVLIFLADHTRWLGLYRAAGLTPRSPGLGDLLLAIADAVIAAQNAVVAAESLGLGSCYIGDILEQEEEVRHLLSLPPETVPAAMLVIGPPAESQTRRKKPERFAEEYIVHENAYQPQSEETLRAMYQEREARENRPNADINARIKAFMERKYESAFSQEMNRSAGQYLTRFAGDQNPEGF